MLLTEVDARRTATTLAMLGAEKIITQLGEVAIDLLAYILETYLNAQ